MELFNFKNNNIKEVKIKPFKLEKEIQSLIEKNTETFFDLEFIATELTIGNYRVDTLCYDKENNSFTIIEYKKGKSYSVIDQGYTYLQLMLNNKSDFVLSLSKHLNKVIDVNYIDWSQSKIIFISQSFNSYQKDSVNFKDLPFELYEIKRFENDIISLNLHESSSNVSIDSLSSSNGKGVIKSITKEVKVFDEDEVLSKLNDEIIQKYTELKESLFSELDDLKLIVKAGYVSFSVGGRKGVAYLNVQKNGFKMHIRRGHIMNDGTKSKGYFTIDDPKKISKTKSWTWKSGAKGVVYEIRLDKNFDIDYIKFLIKQKYNSIIN